MENSEITIQVLTFSSFSIPRVALRKTVQLNVRNYTIFRGFLYYCATIIMKQKDLLTKDYVALSFSFYKSKD